MDTLIALVITNGYANVYIAYTTKIIYEAKVNLCIDITRGSYS